MGNSTKNNGVGFVDSGTLMFWGLIMLLLILVVGNFVLTVIIISFFKIGLGMENIKFDGEMRTIKFYGAADFNNIYKKDGLIEGFKDSPTEIHGDSIALNLLSRSGQSYTKLSMGSNGTELKSLNTIQLKDPITNEIVFSTTPKTKYHLGKPTKSLESYMLYTMEMASPIDEKLKIQSTNKITFRGTEGTKVDGKELFFSADQNIFLKSLNGSIYIVGHNGVYVDIKNIPTVHTDFGVRTNHLQFKLCACYPKGNIYRVDLSKLHNNMLNKDACRNYDKKFDPCL